MPKKFTMKYECISKLDASMIIMHIEIYEGYWSVHDYWLLKSHGSDQSVVMHVSGGGGLPSLKKFKFI